MSLTRRSFVRGLAAAGATAAAGAHAVPALAATSDVKADDGATVAAETWIDSRTLDLTISTAVLTTGNPVTDTAPMVRLLLPPGWTANPQRTWPVLYLLHGAGDDYTSWTRSTDVEALTAGLGLVVAMPAGGHAGFYSDWWNLGAGGPPEWETFHLTEVRQILERGYGAGTTRAIAGLSMGGFGTMSYAARHPGMFRAAASYSGVVHTTFTPPPGSALLTGPALVEASLSSSGFDALALWGDASAQASIWAAHNPYALAPAVTGIPLFVSAGNGQPGPLDPPGTPPDYVIEPLVEAMGEALVARLDALGANVTADFYGPGIHNWPEWQQELHRSFPMLMNAIGVQ